MANPALFAARGPADVPDLLRHSPLCWVVSAGETGPLATPLPLMPETDAQGQLVALIGHFARGNPQVAALQRDPLALVLMLGPHGYISPSWMADRSQAPTWNYASTQCRVRITFNEDPAWTAQQVRELVDAQEAGRPGAWRVDDMGPRYALLARHIVAFRAELLSVAPKFKLGQDERRDVYADIEAGLARQGEPELLAWMRRFNPGG